jgi:hypothetical protein
MSIQGTPRIDRDIAARLVDGRDAGPVAVVLRAAAAPAHAEELAGEDTAVAAFRSAALAPVPGRPSALRRTLTKALVVKGVLALAIAGSTGVVLAASEGALPVPWSDRQDEAPVNSTTTVPPTAPKPGNPDPNAPAGGADDGKQHAATPDPSITGLCDAYTSGGEKDLDNPAFGALADAAGGRDRIPEYCETVEAPGPSVPGEPDVPDVPDVVPGDPGQGVGPGRTPEVPTPTGHPSVPSVPSGDQVDETRTSRPSRAPRTNPTSSPLEEDTVTETPDSPAPGAATAVPPSGAEPPSVGD